MRNIFVENLRDAPVESHQVEIVERKGRGHPDTICDSIMDNVSVSLCKEYLKKFGVILHHNVDKSLLVAGSSEKCFGGGKITEAMKMIFGDRATYDVNSESIDVPEIAISSAKKWFRENLRFVDPVEHVKYQVEIKPGSPELTDIFKRELKGKLLGANDTSAAVGYAPLTETERIVLSLENYLNSHEFMKRFPESGEDIKVMAFREKKTLHLTIAMAFVDKFVDSEKDYFRKKQEITEEAKRFVDNNLDKDKIGNSQIYLNTLDQQERGLGGVYLTVTGTSAEDADCGQVGRGNRVNGLIALNRPAGSEAGAGKNPVSHVGKIYSLLSHKIANEVHKSVPDIKEVYVWLCSQIGLPIDQPKVAAAQVIMTDASKFASVEKQIHETIDKELADIGEFTKELAFGKHRIC